MLPDNVRKELLESLPAILNIQDICLLLKVSPSTVRRELNRAKGLRGYLAEGEWNIARADLLDYLSRHATL